MRQELVQIIKHLPRKHKDWSPVPTTHIERVEHGGAHTYNPSARKAEAGRSHGFTGFHP